MKKITIVVLSVILALTLALGSACSRIPEGACLDCRVLNCVCEDGIFLFNPYRNVDFATTGRFKADFHAHTTNSDGRLSPQESARRFAALGFDLLAFNDHDDWMFGRWHSRQDPNHTWIENPTTPASGSNSRQTNQTYPWENFGVTERHGLIPIQAAELSRFHHTGSFFTSFSDNHATLPNVLPGNSDAHNILYLLRAAEQFSMEEYPCNRAGDRRVAEGRGRFEIFHPERYFETGTIAGDLALLDDPTRPINAEWYQNMINEFNTILSMEMFNQIGRHPSRHIYDRVMRDMFPHRPVWLSANSDDHGLHYGQSVNVMLIPQADFAGNVTESFKVAWEQGAYFAKSFGGYDIRARTGYTGGANATGNLDQRRWDYLPVVEDISIDYATGNITVLASLASDAVELYMEWITEDGVVVEEGFVVNYKQNPLIRNFVRGELTSRLPDGTIVGTTMLQPFGVGAFDPTSWFFYFTGVDVPLPRGFVLP